MFADARDETSSLAWVIGSRKGQGLRENRRSRRHGHVVRRNVLCIRQKKSKVAGAFALNMYSTGVPEIDCQSVTLPDNFDLSMKSGSRHT